MALEMTYNLAVHIKLTNTALALVDPCQEGFVWRKAFAGDHVCGSAATRRQAAIDKATARSRLTLTKEQQISANSNGAKHAQTI
jgi:hypothetical protein